MKAYERLLSYVKVFTPSSEETGTSPSTQYQFDLARLLVQELKELGVKDADVDEHCYVYGHIPATRGYESRQKLGFIAHMDTVSDFCDHPVTPVITPNYDGKDLALGTSGRVLSPKMFPHLSTLKGRTLITSDGTTILGADDKAGIAEIMTIIEYLNDNTIPHGPLCIAFTPDEEIGMGPAHFDIKKFEFMLQNMELDLKQKASKMSSGMMAKLKIAVTLSRNARLTMLDEPLNGIDIIARERVISTVTNNFAPDKTFVLSSHLVDELENVIDYAIFIKHGHVELMGPVNELRAANQKSIVDLYKQIYADCQF